MANINEIITTAVYNVVNEHYYPVYYSYLQWKIKYIIYNKDNTALSDPGSFSAVFVVANLIKDRNDLLTQYNDPGTNPDDKILLGRRSADIALVLMSETIDQVEILDWEIYCDLIGSNTINILAEQIYVMYKSTHALNIPVMNTIFSNIGERLEQNLSLKTGITYEQSCILLHNFLYVIVSVILDTNVSNHLPDIKDRLNEYVNLVITPKPAPPTGDDYEFMLNNCHIIITKIQKLYNDLTILNLTVSPDIPDTTLTDKDYYNNMFNIMDKRMDTILKIKLDVSFRPIEWNPAPPYQHTTINETTYYNIHKTAGLTEWPIPPTVGNMDDYNNQMYAQLWSDYNILLYSHKYWDNTKDIPVPLKNILSAKTVI